VVLPSQLHKAELPTLARSIAACSNELMAMGTHSSVPLGVSYFGEKGYYLFLPFGDNEGAIDLALSEDGFNRYCMQSKFTIPRHKSMQERYPDRPVWVAGLYQAGRSLADGHVNIDKMYDENSFDWLFVATPGGDYLFEWKQSCHELGRASVMLQLAKHAEKYRIS
jgi:hypothetical protein